jgi:hypothetical protein
VCTSPIQPTPAASTAEAGLTGGSLIGVIIAAIVVLAVLLFVAMRAKKSGGADMRPPKDEDHTTSFTNPIYQGAEVEEEPQYVAPPGDTAEALYADSEETFYAAPANHYDDVTVDGYDVGGGSVGGGSGYDTVTNEEDAYSQPISTQGQGYLEIGDDF